MKIKTFSEEISAKDEKAYDDFVQKVYAFCERWKNVLEPKFNQSSGIIGTKMITHHTAIVKYEQNGS